MNGRVAVESEFFLAHLYQNRISGSQWHILTGWIPLYTPNQQCDCQSTWV